MGTIGCAVRVEYDGEAYQASQDSVLSVIGKLEIYFRDAQMDVPYATQRDIGAANARQASFNSEAAWLRAVVTELFRQRKEAA